MFVYFPRVLICLVVSFKFLSRRALSLLMEKHQSRDKAKTLEMPGLCAGMRTLSSRLAEVQSRMNWVSWGWLWFLRRKESGCTSATMLRSSGKILCRTSAVALQWTSTCSDDSTGDLQSLQAGLRLGWSDASTSAVRKSPARNLRWGLSFLTSCVVWMFSRVGDGQSVLTARHSSMSSLSCCWPCSSI